MGVWLRLVRFEERICMCSVDDESIVKGWKGWVSLVLYVPRFEVFMVPLLQLVGLHK